MFKKIVMLATALMLATLVFLPKKVEAKWIIVIRDNEEWEIWVPDPVSADEITPFHAHYDENGAYISEEEARFGAYNDLNGTFVQNGKRNFTAKIGQQKQGAAADAAFDQARPAGWNRACTFNLTLNDKADDTLKEGTLALRAPMQFQKTGRQFAIMGINKDGKVILFENTSKVPFNVTSDISLEGYAFELIYKD